MPAHGIMFHHFHDDKQHIRGQGSISDVQLRSMLDRLSKDYTLLDAKVFMEKQLNGTIAETDICITFDDALKCQYDIAYKVLQERNLKAFWFIYSSPLQGHQERLEVYRHFRFKYFDTVEDFYQTFFSFLTEHESLFQINVTETLQRFDPDQHLLQYSFYTREDKIFRYFRDAILGREAYFQVMDMLISNYDMTGVDLWIHREDILTLYRDDHVIGLHSHTHPTDLATIPYEEQREEYTLNKTILEDVTGCAPHSASYPCNSYNRNTDEIMHELGVRIAFNALMEQKPGEDPLLHIPRMDHAYLI